MSGTLLGCAGIKSPPQNEREGSNEIGGNGSNRFAEEKINERYGSKMGGCAGIIRTEVLGGTVGTCSFPGGELFNQTSLSAFN